MELIPNRRQETALTTTSQQPWALAIREQYGALPAFAARFTPKVQKYCAQNMVKAVENNLPTFGRIVSTYGEEGIGAIVATHMTDAILRMGEDRDVDPYDVQFIASAICESERFKTLRFTTVLGFFHLLKCGEFDIYGKVTPRKILEAFRKYAITAQAKENRIAYEKDCREYEAKRKREAAEAISWQEYAAGKGIPDASLMDFIDRQAREAKARRDFWKTFADVIFTLVSVCAFIADWQKHEKNSPRKARTGANFDAGTQDGQFTTPSG